MAGQPVGISPVFSSSRCSDASSELSRCSHVIYRRADLVTCRYPLLLDQILAITPEDHPDRANLQLANTRALAMAEHINEYKKRSEAVSRIVNKKDTGPRRDSTRSISSTVSKKLFRGTQKAKNALGMVDISERDDMFDTLSALVDSTKAACIRFEGEMKDWSRTTKIALESQVALVEGWIDLYAPLEGESPENSSHHRLCVFLDEVLIPLIEGPWRELVSHFFALLYSNTSS